MQLTALVDPIFRLPFLVGLLLAFVVPPVGCYIRLRDEWLAALALSQLAAAGALLSLFVGMPPMVGAFGVAVVAGLLKGRLSRAGNDLYAVGISAGWAAVLLVAANTTHGDELGHAFTDGQIYFAGVRHLAGALVLVVAAGVVLARISEALLVARLMPERYTANRAPVWRAHMMFDLLVAAVVAVATTAIGVVATFTLVFLPASLAFRRASGWRRALAASVAVSLGAYLLAFAGAILLDQPFGPVFVAALLVAGGLVTARGWLTHGRSEPAREAQDDPPERVPQNPRESNSV